MDKINILLCDDNSEFLRIFKKRMAEYSEHFIFEDMYSSGKEVLEIKDFGKYDVVFLDISMPDISGIELADIIRKKNNTINIVFITNMEELVFESIKYRPFRFIRKGRLDVELEECLKALIKERELGLKTIEIGNKSNRIIVTVSNIIYVESFHHEITVHCIDGQYKVRDTLHRLENVLNEFSFMRIHKGCIVNPAYTYCIEKGTVILKDYVADKKELKISRNRIAMVKQQFLHYQVSVRC